VSTRGCVAFMSVELELKTCLRFACAVQESERHFELTIAGGANSDGGRRPQPLGYANHAV